MADREERVEGLEYFVAGRVSAANYATDRGQCGNALPTPNRAGRVPSAQWRKDRPIVRGVLDYFPDALLEVAYCSKVGNDQHNPGQPLHWAKEKSTDEADALVRHLIDRGKIDTDGVRHSAKVAWRALALLQREIEAERIGRPFSYKTYTVPLQVTPPEDYGQELERRCGRGEP